MIEKAATDRLLVPAIFQTTGFIGSIAAILFLTAGTFFIPAFWAYLAIVAIMSALALHLADPELWRERARPGGQPLATKYRLIMLLPLAHWAVAGLDRGRLHWSGMLDPWIEAMGFILFTFGWVVLVWAVQVNPFFSSVARIQTERGHQLISTGPYRWVRHPGYSGGVLLALTSGIALGSWISVLVGALGVLLILWRTCAEDQLLRCQLPGYDDYASRVPHRLLPGLW